MIPDTRVPCHELSATSQSVNGAADVSAVEIQSPGSEGSLSRPLPSFAVLNVPPASGDTKS